MGSFLTVLMTAIPSALMAIAAKVLTEKMLQATLEKIIIYGLEKLTPLSTNTLDDKIAADIIEKIKG